jgi:hypothetical protein
VVRDGAVLLNRLRRLVLARRATREARTALCQRAFYDHVIRDEDDLARIREHIVANPARWADRS